MGGVLNACSAPSLICSALHSHRDAFLGLLRRHARLCCSAVQGPQRLHVCVPSSFLCHPRLCALILFVPPTSACPHHFCATHVCVPSSFLCHPRLHALIIFVPPTSVCPHHFCATHICVPSSFLCHPRHTLQPSSFLCHLRHTLQPVPPRHTLQPHQGHTLQPHQGHLRLLGSARLCCRAFQGPHGLHLPIRDGRDPAAGRAN